MGDVGMSDLEVSELELPFLPIEDPEFAQDPAARFTQARQSHPWLARCQVGYVLTEHRAMRGFMRHDDAMAMGFNEIVEYMGATGTPWGNFIAGSIQVQSGETHKRLRDVLRPAFTPRQANRYREVMRGEIERLCDEWLTRRTFDFEEFVSYYPITVLCRMIGASPSAIPDLRDALEALGLAMSMDRAILPRLQQGMAVLETFARDLVARRRSGERPDASEDLLDLLLAARDSGGLDEEELINLMIFLFGGGYDTSKNVLTLIMHLLIDRPDVYERCAREPEWCRAVVNEVMRFHSPGTATRKLLADIHFRGVRFPAGTLVMFPWGFSGRDETAAPDPDAFLPGRPGAATASFPFGMGAHICLGQFIARAQIEEGLHVIARRLDQPRRAGPHGWRPFPGVWGIAGLPIEVGAGA